MTISARAIVAVLGGQWLGSSGLCRCPVHEDRRPSLQISDGPDGLRVHCHAGCDFRTVRDALRSQGLLHGYEGQICTPSAVPPDDHHNSDLERIEKARTIWKASRPIAGTLAEHYLRRRGIRIPLPASLRFHPGLKDPHSSRTFPAMVAGVTVWPSRKVVAVHRTFLTEDGLAKAPVMSPKCMLGPVKGGAVRLGYAEPLLCISEGIETALSLVQATSMPTWACLSTTGIRSLVLPDLPVAAEVVIGADNDPPGLAAAKDAAAAWTMQGRQVRIAVPHTPGHDFNDVCRSAA